MQKMKGKRVLAFSMSPVLLIGVIIGVVLVTHNKHNDGEGVSRSHNKVVHALCQNAHDQNLCYNVLNPVNPSDPKDYISAVVESSMDSVIKSLNMTTDRLLKVEHDNSTHVGVKMALTDCNEMLQLAIDELEASRALVARENTAADIEEDAVGALKNWLGAVMAYQSSCLDGFDAAFPEERNVLEALRSGGLDDVWKRGGLALNVLSVFSNVCGGGSASVSSNSSRSRRLLAEADRDGYPTWFSGMDRKLLSKVGNGGVVPNAVVAKDGSGQYRSVLDAINSYPKGYQGRYIIHVKAGVYDEYITVDKKKKGILLYGDGRANTIITGRKNVKEGFGTYRTATFATVADDFIGKSITFANTAGPEKEQAVALRVQGDRAAFFDCGMHGFQDTLYTHCHRQFYRNCEISGTIDFIFGHASALIQDSKITVRNPGPTKYMNVVVADGRLEKDMATGLVLQNCEITAEAGLPSAVRTYLARPWKAFSRAVFMESFIGGFIHPERYSPWNPLKEPNTEHCYFAEFGNRGPGANVASKAQWGKGLISKDEAGNFTAKHWIQSSAWLPYAADIPFYDGFAKH